MDPIVNTIVILEKELELEHHGLLCRTRRWIGDAGQAADDRWYQPGRSQVVETRHYSEEPRLAVQAKPHREARRSILARLLNLPRPCRQPAANEC